MTPKPTHWKLYTISAVVVAALCGILILDGPGDQPATEYDAERACKSFIDGRLKVPATADYSDIARRGGHPSWRISGVVDAENSFGARLRMHWSCTVTIDGDDWRLDSLTGIN